MRRWTAAAVAAIGVGCVAGCEAGEVPTQPLDMEVHALTGGACGNPDSPSPGLDPVADITSLRVVVQGLDAETGQVATLVQENRDLKGRATFVVSDVPEGSGRTLTLFGTGQQAQWYGREPNIFVRRGATNQVSMLLSRFGGFSCVPTPTEYVNSVFPAAVELGDGRVLMTGGFTELGTVDGRPALTGASRVATIFDPRTGTTANVGDLMVQGRGGHAMVFVPSPTGQDQGKVLIIGGARSLEVDESLAFPFKHRKENGIRSVEVLDVAALDGGDGTFAEVGQMDLSRVFPRAHLLGDGTVAITGGGTWPVEPTLDYQDVEIVDPEADGGPAFLDVKSFTSFWPRTGHSLTFLRNTGEGLSQLLVWGGTTPGVSSGTVGEILKQSAQQRQGIDGSFTPIEDVEIAGASPDELPFTFFHEMTPLSASTFLLTGGVRASCGVPTDPSTCTLQAPRDDEAWVIRISFPDAERPKASVQKVPGLGTGRVFHSAVSATGAEAAVVGGWSGTQAIAGDKVMLFDLASGGWSAAPEGGDAFAARGGHAAIRQRSGAMLLVGGESNLSALQGNQRAFVEIYAPSNIPIP